MELVEFPIMGLWLIVQQTFLYKSFDAYLFTLHSKMEYGWDITSHLLEELLSKPQELKGVGKNVEKSEPLCMVGGNVKWYSHYRKRYSASSKN